VMGSQIDGVCDAATSLSGALQGNKVRALAVASPARLASFPDVPTAAEAGLPRFQAQGWNALFAPKGTPEPIIQRLNAALRQALAGQMLRSRFAELSSVVPTGDGQSPAYVDSIIPSEIEKYRQLLQPK
jgi:tripartite-type tricarboxylate transporter receptor subunit TctC